MFGSRQEEGGLGNRDHGDATAEMAMGCDEIAWHPVTAEITRSLGVVHTDGEILVHFKVKMGWVHAVIGPYHADLLPAPDLLPLTYDDLVEMAIE